MSNDTVYDWAQFPRNKLIREAERPNVQLNIVSPGFSEGLPDVSKFPEFLQEKQDSPLAEFIGSWERETRNTYVEKLSFNPVEAKYFNKFMETAKQRAPPLNSPGNNFSLSEDQLAVFKKNGFVVTTTDEHWGMSYYRIYNNDLPVLITADSILHAFHKSYDSMLKDLEAKYCVPTLMKIFTGMRTALQEFAPKYNEGPFAQSFKDMDFYLTVGINLLNSEEHYHAGDANDPTLNEPDPDDDFMAYYYHTLKKEKMKIQINTVLGDGNDRIDEALKMCQEEQLLTVNLFGKERQIDFSIMKPRGHYTKTAELRRYFRAFSWLAKIDLIIAGDGSNVQQTGSAVVLYMLLTSNKEIEATYHKYNKIIEVLVGPSNSMDARQLGVLLDQVFKLKNFESLNSNDALEKLQAKILETNFGEKKYNSGNWRSFTFIGQKFSIDNWAQSKVITNDDTPGANVIYWQGRKIDRHSTSAVEIAYSVLGNDDAIPIIYQRINDNSAKNRRDGMLYHPYLMAARKTVDVLPQEAWTTSIYAYWLTALRKLSKPMDERFPEAMRTQAFAMKKMETQLASWAQVRHDNILYIEQEARCGASCDYPVGFVEPYVEFWEAMETLCMALIQVWSTVAFDGKNMAESDVVENMPKFDVGSMRESSITFFTNFAQHVRMLRDISTHELAQQPLTKEQTLFLKTIVEEEDFGSGESTWSGWYPTLFYGRREDLVDADLIVADTYTNTPADDDPGCVVHQALGLPRRMLMAVNNGVNTCCYVGPVFNYYEFELPGTERWTDEIWAEKFENKAAPPPPEWTAAYSVPN